MLAQRNTKLGFSAHTLFLHAHICFCMRVCPVSQLALRPVSLEPDVNGWIDKRRRGTTLHITSLDLQLNKHSVIDGFLVSE